MYFMWGFVRRGLQTEYSLLPPVIWQPIGRKWSDYYTAKADSLYTRSLGYLPPFDGLPEEGVALAVAAAFT